MTATRTPGRTTDGVIFACHATILCVTKVVLVSRRTIGRRTASCILHEFSTSQPIFCVATSLAYVKFE